MPGRDDHAGCCRDGMTHPARPTGVRTRLRTVLDLAWESDDRAAFYKGDGGVRIVVPHATWHEMGRPKQITVTIEPGDQLSG